MGKLKSATLGARWRRLFESKRKAAVALAGQPEAALATVERALAQAGRVGKLRGALTDLRTLGRLARAWARRDYRKVSRSTIVMVLGALVYFLAPLDAIFDAVPVFGFLDDAAVIAWVVSEIRAELADFRAWEDAQLQVN